MTRTTDLRKLRVRRQRKRNILIHNHLFNAALYFKNRIEERLNRDDGIAFGYMACLVMLAFTIEAHINFLGYTLIPTWKEFRRFDEKLNDVLTRLQLSPDMSSRPYASINILKNFRDTCRARHRR